MKKHFKIYRSSLQNKNLNFLNKRIKKKNKSKKQKGNFLKKIGIKKKKKL